MTSITPSLGLSGVLALRAEILQRSQALGQIARAPTAAPGATGESASGFADTMTKALQAVNGLQQQSEGAATAFERGDNQDIAAVMLSRQKAAIAFEATLQARNRLLGAYRDIMNMPV